MPGSHKVHKEREVHQGPTPTCIPILNPDRSPAHSAGLRNREHFLYDGVCRSGQTPDDQDGNMNRRQFVRALGLGTLAARLPSIASADPVPQIAITMDDPNLEPTPRFSPEERNARILAALRNHRPASRAL